MPYKIDYYRVYNINVTSLCNVMYNDAVLFINLFNTTNDIFFVKKRTSKLTSNSIANL